MNYILLQEHELIFELSQDHLSRSTLLQHCDIYNGYPTTSNHIISFPNAPPNLHIQDFILEESQVIRKKRGAQYITDTDNRSSRYDLVPYQTLPLAQRLYSITAFEGLPPCQTQPIKDPKLLREIKQWNVTNHDFLRRSQLYEAEDPCLSVLRTIRYCEYRFRQLAWLHSIRSKRPLNYAEHAIQQDLEHGVTDIFDDYLSREFGPLRIEILRDQNQLKSRIVPFFQEEDIKSPREETTAKLPLPKTTVLPLTEFTTTTPKTTETSLTTMKTPITTKSRPTTTPKPYQITSITSHNAATTTWVKSNPVYSETRRPSPVPEVKTTSTQRPPFTTPIITTQTTVKPTSVTAHFKTTVTVLQTTTRVAPTTKRVHKANPFDYSLHQISQTSKPAIQASSSEPKYYHEVPLTKTTSEPSSHDYIQHQTTTINKPSPQVHSFETNYRQVVPTSEPVRLASSLESQIPQDTPITSTSIPEQYMKPSPTNPHLKLHGITKIFRREFNNVCVRQYLNNQRIHEISRADPTWAARTLLGTNDVVATLADNNLLVTRCRKVKAERTISDHNVNNTCYDLLPVLIKGQLWFSIPGTKDLVETAAEIPCPYLPIHQPKQTQPVLPPGILNQNNVKPFIFDAPPLYHHLSLNFAPTIRFQIQHLQKEYAVLRSKLHKRGIVENTLSQLKSAGNSVTQTLSAIYEKTTEKLSAGVERIKWSLVHILLWTALPAVIGFLLIVLCVCGVKFYFIRGATGTATSALFQMASNFTSKKRRRPQVNNLDVEAMPTAPVSAGTLYVPRIYAVPYVVNSIKNSLPYVQLTLNNIPTAALVDSGASISYMKLSTLQSLGPNIRVENNVTKAQAANGSTVELLASIDLIVKIGNHLLKHRFLVSPDQQCPAPVLLGSDFIKKLNESGLKVTIDLHNHLLTIGEDVHTMIQINSIAPVSPSTYDVRLLEKITLPKRSSTIVTARIDGYASPNPLDFIIEDNKRDSDLIYIVGRSLVTPDSDGKCIIVLLNPSYTDATLYARMKVAHATPIDCPHEQIYAIQNKPDYIPPEANWEDRIPHFPTITTDYHDIAKEVNLDKSVLNEDQKEQLRNVIRSHANAFVGPDGHLGHYNGPIKHRIDLVENATIPTRKIYRVPLEKRMEIERQISQMIEDGIIRESNSAFCSPIVLKFRPYIDGAKCTVVTDHAPLKALLHRKDLTGRLAKYQLVLQEFDITITYQPGKANVVCDALSRHLPHINTITQHVDELQPLSVDLINKEQNNCPWIASYKQALTENESHPDLANFILLNGILYKLPEKVFQDPQVVLPENSRIKQTVMKQSHESKFGTAHLGIQKTRKAVAKVAIWNKMSHDIGEFVKACPVCQLRKDPSAYRTNEPLDRFETPKRPWQRVHSDVIGPLPLTLEGNKFIIVFVDAFSKFVIAEPIPDQKAITTADVFINRMKTLQQNIHPILSFTAVSPTTLFVLHYNYHQKPSSTKTITLNNSHQPFKTFGRMSTVTFLPPSKPKNIITT
ncbi:retroviral aspartyl protease [Ancylostoma duodenale]|uniref:RNA-directed DNA polymerase n=1 Tax=Ancylostoma duodenale TaxID=51022 RepID=A0A0C2FPI1_9BILA|nr:retroviral aspartyl protease [Ancylostoma duodenale]